MQPYLLNSLLTFPGLAKYSNTHFHIFFQNWATLVHHGANPKICYFYQPIGGQQQIIRFCISKKHAVRMVVMNGIDKRPKIASWKWALRIFYLSKSAWKIHHSRQAPLPGTPFWNKSSHRTGILYCHGSTRAFPPAHSRCGGCCLRHCLCGLSSWRTKPLFEACYEFHRAKVSPAQPFIY